MKHSSSGKITIAIDGYSSCGKSTLAKALAAKLHYIFIDSGAMYRAVTLYASRHQLAGAGFIREKKIIEHLDDIELHFENNPVSKRPEVFLNGENVEQQIRGMEISSLVSKVAAIREVREKLVAEQQKMGLNGGVIMDGRDIGSVVFPHAELKLFITAEPEIRAQRRYEELLPSNPDIRIEDVLENLQERDLLDSTRKEGPLIRTEDAILIDNSHLTPDEQLSLALTLVAEKISIPKTVHS